MATNKKKEKDPKFAEMIRLARTRNGLSQRQLGDQLRTPGRPNGVYNTYVGQIEKGEKIPSDEVCEKMAEVLQLDTTEVLLAAFEAKAEARGSKAAKELFRKMKRALSDPVIQQLLAIKEPMDPGILEGLSDAHIRAALSDEAWRKVISRFYQVRKKRNMLELMSLVEGMNDQQWTGMITMLGGTGLGNQD